MANVIVESTGTIVQKATSAKLRKRSSVCHLPDFGNSQTRDGQEGRRQPQVRYAALIGHAETCTGMLSYCLLYLAQNQVRLHILGVMDTVKLLAG